MKNFLTKIANIIKQGYYSVVGEDDLPFPSGTVSSNGKSAKFIRLSVYGICSNPPKNSHVFLFNSQGKESHKFGLINDFVNRKKGLKEGEAALFNSLTGAYVLMKEDGTIEIESPSDINVTAPNMNLSGNLNVDGDITGTGDTTIDGEVIADAQATAIELSQHFHLGNIGYNTDIPTPGTSPGVPKPTNAPTYDDGDQTVDFETVGAKNVGSMSENVEAHTHSVSGVEPGSSTVTSGAPN